jgi:hypothetical protein
MIEVAEFLSPAPPPPTRLVVNRRRKTDPTTSDKDLKKNEGKKCS